MCRRGEGGDNVEVYGLICLPATVPRPFGTRSDCIGGGANLEGGKLASMGQLPGPDMRKVKNLLRHWGVVVCICIKMAFFLHFYNHFSGMHKQKKI